MIMGAAPEIGVISNDEFADILSSVDSGDAPAWKVKYLYDGSCSMCKSLKAVLARQDGGKGAWGSAQGQQRACTRRLLGTSSAPGHVPGACLGLMADVGLQIG